MPSGKECVKCSKGCHMKKNCDIVYLWVMQSTACDICQWYEIETLGEMEKR